MGLPPWANINELRSRQVVSGHHEVIGSGSDAVRDYGQIVRAGHRGDLFQLRKIPGAINVRLKNGHRSRLKQVPKAVTGELVLTSSDQNFRKGLFDFPVGLNL